MKPIKIVLSILLIVLILLVLLSILFFILKEISDKKHTQYVFHESVALRKLIQINKRTKFYSIKDIYETHVYDSKANYENISCNDYLIYQLQFASSKIRTEIKNAKQNSSNYDSYTKKIEKEVVPIQLKECLKGYKLKKIKKIEDKEIAKRLKFPNMDFIVQITLHEKGTFKYKKQIFHQKEIISLIERIAKKRGDDYLDSNIRNSVAKVEIAKLSEEMKKSILARDGFQCVECSSKEGLVIDHIKPVLKKGKTEASNLQTLCIHCKMLKDNFY